MNAPPTIRPERLTLTDSRQSRRCHLEIRHCEGCGSDFRPLKPAGRFCSNYCTAVNRQRDRLGRFLVGPVAGG